MQTNNKMAVAPVGKLIWQMSIPPLISMFLQYSYNLIDSAFVARLSENALTAVSLSFPITTLMNAASIWIGVGVNVLIAGYLGQKKQDEANTTVTHGLLLAFGIGALLNLLSLLIMKPYFRTFTNNEEIYQLSIAYMSVCSFMQIPNMVHIAIQKMIQATGNMVAPMWFQIAGGLVSAYTDSVATGIDAAGTVTMTERSLVEVRGIDAAGTVTMTERSLVEVRAGYQEFSRADSALIRLGAERMSADYGEDVRAVYAVKADAEARALACASEATSGAARTAVTGHIFLPERAN